MNKKSGLLGVSGISNDMRDVRKGAEEGNERAVLAYEMYAHSIRKYLGQYLVEMAGCDAIASCSQVCSRWELSLTRRRTAAITTAKSASFPVTIPRLKSS